jgi:hypothetical protein
MNGTYQFQNCNHIEENYPGYFAVAGPYNVSHTNALVQKAEKAACVRARRDQVNLDPEAKIITRGRMAWIIRKKPLIANLANAQQKTEALRIRAGRGGAQG